MTGRRWSEIKAEAMARQPWLASAEALGAEVSIVVSRGPITLRVA